MSALQLLRASLGMHSRRSVQGVVRPISLFRRIPDASATTSGARRSYVSKGKEKEEDISDAAAGASQVEPDEAVPKSAPDDATKTTPEVDEVTAKLQAKQDEIVDLTSRLRYLQADFINLQRISAREKEQTRDFAISRFARDLLETVDTLSMALRSASQTPPPTPSQSSTPPPYFQPSSQPPDALIRGVEATHRLLLQTLAKYHVKPFDPTGDKFDPNLHEALYSAPVPGKTPGEVLACQKVGYMIKDRVLRAAQVGVTADRPQDTTANDRASDN